MDELDAELERAIEHLNARLEFSLKAAGNDEKKKAIYRELYKHVRECMEQQTEWERLKKTLSPEQIERAEERMKEEMEELDRQEREILGELKPPTKQ